MNLRSAKYLLAFSVLVFNLVISVTLITCRSYCFGSRLRWSTRVILLMDDAPDSGSSSGRAGIWPFLFKSGSGIFSARVAGIVYYDSGTRKSCIFYSSLINSATEKLTVTR
jgi:hypothetical protein